MKRRRLFLEKGIALIAAAGCLITWVNHIFALAGQPIFLSPAVTLGGAILVAALVLLTEETHNPREGRAFDWRLRPAQIVLGALICYDLALGGSVLMTVQGQTLTVPPIGPIQSRAVGVLCFQPFTMITFLLSAVFSWFKRA